MAYNLLKAFLDPVIFVLVLIAVGFLVSLRKRGKKPERLFLAVSFFVLYVTSVTPISNGLCYFLEKEYIVSEGKYAGKLDIIVIMGGGTYYNKYSKKTGPTNQTAARLLYAVQAFKENRADYLICAGNGKGQFAEAQIMHNAALRLGIPEQNIIRELISRNTREHAKELNKMFNNKKLRIGLVTSAYHMQRCEKEFKKYFPYVVPLQSDYLFSSTPLSPFTFLPHSSKLYKFSIALREMIGIVWYKIKD